MWEFIVNNAASIITGAAILAIIAGVIIYKLRRSKKNPGCEGCDGCSGGSPNSADSGCYDKDI